MKPACTLLMDFFEQKMAGAVVTIYTDNQGCLHGTLKGSSASAEMNIIIARFWMGCAAQSVAVVLRRVESKANLADGPTRYNETIFQKYNAQEVQPQLPSWTFDLWDVSSCGLSI